VYSGSRKTFEHYDSSGDRNSAAAIATARKFWAMLGEKGQSVSPTLKMIEAYPSGGCLAVLAFRT
jgi:hypothetical protein